MAFGDGIDWSNEARRAAAAGMPSSAPSELLQAISNASPMGQRVVDCGCGIGSYYPQLAAAGFRYLGVDQCLEALRIARARYPEGTFSLAHLCDDWPARRQPFDVAVTNAVLQHNTHAEKERILPRIAQAVKQGGLFAMQESTVLEPTATQLRYDQWVDLVERHGFALLRTWHPNEFGVTDGYLFRRNLPTQGTSENPMNEILIRQLIQQYAAEQRDFEAFWLYQQAVQIQPRVIVEIGIKDGGNLRLFSELVPPTGLVVGIDPGGRVGWDVSEVPCRVVKITGDSHAPTTRQDLESLLAGQPIDLLFIDGDHETAGMLADYRDYEPLVRPGGIIAVHDIFYLEPVSEAWRALAGTGLRRLESPRRHDNIGIGIIFKEPA